MEKFVRPVPSETAAALAAHEASMKAARHALLVAARALAGLEPDGPDCEDASVEGTP